MQNTTVRVFIAARDALFDIARSDKEGKQHAWAAAHHLMSIPSPVLHAAFTETVARSLRPDTLPPTMVGKEEITALREIWGDLAEQKSRAEHHVGYSWSEARENRLRTIRLLLDLFGVDPSIPDTWPREECRS